MVYATTKLIAILLHRPRVRQSVIILIAVLYYAVTAFIYYQGLNIGLNLAVSLSFNIALSMLYHVSMGKRIFSAMFVHILSFISESITVAVLALFFQTSKVIRVKEEVSKLEAVIE